jgi:hypothetical protein
MLGRLGQMPGAFTRLRGRRSAWRSRAVLTLRMLAMAPRHFLRMTLEALGLFVLSCAVKFLESMLQAVRHRAAGTRTLGPRSAGVLGSGRPGENQGGKNGQEVTYFHTSRNR